MVRKNAHMVLIDGWNYDHVHSAKTTNINFASFFVNPPDKIPANISGYTVLAFSYMYCGNYLWIYT